MLAMSRVVLVALMAIWTAPLAAAPSLYQTTPELSPAKPILLAQGKKNGGAKKGMRQKIISGEATIKSKDQTKVDFDAADIGGQRKTPMGTLINQNKADKNYDFVKIRLRWYPEMMQSAASLDSGNSR